MSTEDPPPPDTNPTNEKTDDTHPEQKRTIHRITQDESSRRYSPNRSFVISYHTKNDKKYIHSLIKTDAYYFPTKQHALYHFDDEKQIQDF